MSVLTERISSAEGKEFGAYVARPQSPNGHAIILLQEIFGVTEVIRKAADDFAKDGYTVYAPDLFWRFEPGMQLSYSKEDVERGLGLLQKYDLMDGVSDIDDTLKHLRSQPGFAGKVATIGFCLGGHLAYLSAVKTSVDAAVAYYGIGIDESIRSIGLPQRPVMIHYGEQDSFLTKEALETVQSQLGPLPHVTIHLYPESGHGFYTRPTGDDKALAHDRTERFLREVFEGGNA